MSVEPGGPGGDVYSHRENMQTPCTVEKSIIHIYGHKSKVMQMHNVWNFGNILMLKPSVLSKD